MLSGLIGVLLLAELLFCFPDLLGEYANELLLHATAEPVLSAESLGEPGLTLYHIIAENLDALGVGWRYVDVHLEQW